MGKGWAGERPGGVEWHDTKGGETYPSAVRRVVMHDDLGLSIFASIPHNPTMIIAYTHIPKKARQHRVSFFFFFFSFQTKGTGRGR